MKFSLIIHRVNPKGLVPTYPERLNMREHRQEVVLNGRS
jgi:hypothetical protein